jgi:hypothetical protein
MAASVKVDLMTGSFAPGLHSATPGAFMDKIGICAIFKDEARDLLEWLAFHKMIGVDRFFLYDNGSSDGGSELIRRSDFSRNVMITKWDDRPGQLSAYNHFRINHAFRCHLGRLHRHR